MNKDLMTLLGSMENHINDGIYEITLDIDILDLEYADNEDNFDEAVQFIKKYPDCWKANAYETDYFFLLSKKPKPYQGILRGSEFSYGSTNILSNLPSKLLILAQND